MPSESFTSKERLRNPMSNEEFFINYDENSIIKAYFYPVTTLTGNDLASGINLAPDTMTVMCTTPDKAIAKIAALEEEFDMSLELRELMDPGSTNETKLTNKKNINIIIKMTPDIKVSSMYILTLEPLTNENFYDIQKYLSKSATTDISSSKIEMSFDPIESYGTSYKTQQLYCVNSEVIDEPITSIGIQSPKGALIGNIKVLDLLNNEGDLIADEKTKLIPKIAFPFQTEPTIRLIDFWFGNQICPLRNEDKNGKKVGILDFLDSKNIPYNESFSLNDFIQFGESESSSYRELLNVQKLIVNYKTKDEVPYWQDVQNDYYWNPSTKDGPNVAIDVDRKGELYEKIGTSTSPKGQTQDYFRYLDDIKSIQIYDGNEFKSSTAFLKILEMMTYSLWKDLEFDGAIAISSDGTEQIGVHEIYLIRDKFIQQDRYSVVTNLWESWKKQNQLNVNENKDIITRIESCITMLSGHIKSNYSVNKGDNDDYKILLPYYFELQNAIDIPYPIDYVEYKDLIVKLKSNYFEFGKSEEDITSTYKNISKNKIFELDNNHFIFPELNKSLEVAAIPSSIPSDENLSNGEYSKYLLTLFANSDDEFINCLNDLGKNKLLVNTSFRNTGTFNITNIEKIEKIYLSSVYGSGEWRINFNQNSYLKFNFTFSDDNCIIKLVI